MRVMVVHAHPSGGSLSAALLGATERGLRRAGHDVDRADLVGDGFSAAMSAAEREAYHGETPIIDPLVRHYADSVMAADALIFVYPTWWFGPPAVLKGWFDRVLVPGVAFGFDADGRVRGRLGHLHRLAGVTTYGSPRWVVGLSGDGGRRTIARTLRLSCGLRCRTTWLGLHDVTTRPPADIAGFVRRVEDEMARW